MKAEMNANELMLGDWVNLNNNGAWRMTPDTLKYVAEGCATAEPIRIDRHILEANDLTEYGRYGYIAQNGLLCLFHSYDGEDGFSIISGFNKDKKFFKVELPKPIIYVHELQHVLRVVGLNEQADNFVV